MKQKNCTSCGTLFSCGLGMEAGDCWCDKYPSTFLSDALITCMCETCLYQTVKEKIDVYVKEMTPARAMTDNKAAALSKVKHVIEGIDYYSENEFTVFTSWHHLKRGYCYKNGCRHCPYL